MSCPSCQNTTVTARCTDIKVLQLLIVDENNNVLVDDNSVAFTVGIDRQGTNFEFEYNREAQP